MLLSHCLKTINEKGGSILRGERGQPWELKDTESPCCPLLKDVYTLDNVRKGHKPQVKPESKYTSHAEWGDKGSTPTENLATLSFN